MQNNEKNENADSKPHDVRVQETTTTTNVQESATKNLSSQETNKEKVTPPNQTDQQSDLQEKKAPNPPKIHSEVYGPLFEAFRFERIGLAESQIKLMGLLERIHAGIVTRLEISQTQKFGRLRSEYSTDSEPDCY